MEKKQKKKKNYTAEMSDFIQFEKEIYFIKTKYKKIPREELSNEEI